MIRRVLRRQFSGLRNRSRRMDRLAVKRRGCCNKKLYVCNRHHHSVTVHHKVHICSLRADLYLIEHSIPGLNSCYSLKQD
jgi:hypothetical protein